MPMRGTLLREHGHGVAVPSLGSRGTQECEAVGPSLDSLKDPVFPGMPTLLGSLGHAHQSLQLLSRVEQK